MIIIYTGDNGMLMGKHGEFNMKRWAYDQVIRKPMLVCYTPLIKQGSVREQMIFPLNFTI